MSSSQKNSLTREEARRFVRVAQVLDGDVLAIKHGSRLATRDSIKALSRAFASTKRSRVIIVVVDDFDELSALDEEEMNKNGWFRKEV